jgi:RND family efflux transporter MFP subunit
MRKPFIIFLFIVVVAGFSLGSYWLGRHKEQEIERNLQGGTTPATPGDNKTQNNRKLLYYRNPMGLPDTSPVPKKDSMGMDYVAVYDGEEANGDGAVNISVAKVQKLGVKSEAAALRSLNKNIQATGQIAINERHTYAIAPKFEGWVEKLYVNNTGQSVTKGQALFDVYSPELVSAQREYFIAVHGQSKLANADEDTKSAMKQLADASLARLANWDIAPGNIKQLISGKTRRNLTLYTPVTGVVLEKKAVQGMRFMPGDTLYQIADLSSVWVLADINEQDIGQVLVGSQAQVNIDTYPDKTFYGKVSFIYPTLNPATRTVQVRIELSNSEGLLKPSMYARVTLPTGSNIPVLTVPTSSVIDSGTRQVVLIQQGEGRFAPRTVKLGHRSDDYVEVLDGLAKGEQAVTSALFLIDAESNLKAALAGLGGKDESTIATSTPVAKTPTAHAGHQARGVLNTINKDGTVSITHEAIKDIGWPGMTMDFDLANSALVKGIKPGEAINFEIVERKPDEWIITKLQLRHEGH